MGWVVAVEQVSEVGRGLVMEGFVWEEEDFELNLLWGREPVEVLEDRGNVVTGAGVGEQTSSRVFLTYFSISSGRKTITTNLK